MVMGTEGGEESRVIQWVPCWFCKMKRVLEIDYAAM